MNQFETYLSNQRPAARDALEQLRSLILKAVPQAEEKMNYGIPAFALIPGGKRDQQIMIAGYANHIGFYPHPSTILMFKDELSGYKFSKGTIQFRLTEPLPTDLILRMIRFRKAELEYRD